MKEEQIREIIEQAHMAGQNDAGVDASYYNARLYTDKVLKDVALDVYELNMHLKQIQLSHCKMEHVIKLLAVTKNIFNIDTLANDFDKCQNIDEVKELYNDYILQYNTSDFYIETKIVSNDLNTCRTILDSYINNEFKSDNLIQEKDGIYWGFVNFDKL